MCGIVGMMGHAPVNQDLYDALMMLQHRGQDAAGVMTCHDGRMFLRKANGLVRDVIRAEHMVRLVGNMGIAHVRYRTAGSFSAAEAQPLYVNFPYGLSIVHNGNLINIASLRDNLIRKDLRHLNTDSDSEILLNVFAHELQRQTVGSHTVTPEAIFKAVSSLHARCLGAYAVVIMIAGVGIVGFRDPHGIRPLVYGTRSTDLGLEYMLCSESVALDHLGYTFARDVAPGEAIFVDCTGSFFHSHCALPHRYAPCVFELIYLARPDSLMDRISVYQFRVALGEKLAAKVQAEIPLDSIDVVMPIPDTSRSAALSLAQTLGLSYREGFVKNRYIGRTFIMPGQALRRRSVRQKLNVIASEFQGKRVLLVDDSLIRGTTSREIIQMARDAGASQVYFASAAPEVRYPNVYGIDMPASSELIAHGRTIAEVAESIGADALVYQDLDALYQAARECNPEFDRFEDSVFTGEYVTGGVCLNDVDPPRSYVANLTTLDSIS